MKILTIIGLVLIGVVMYVSFEKPSEKREGEITMGDLIEESKSRLPVTTATDNNKGRVLGISETPAVYERTHLVFVPDGDLVLIRKGGAEVTFKTYVPSKIPAGFVLSPGTISNAVQYGTTVFQAVFYNKNGDSVYIKQYPLKEYLTSAKTTLEKYSEGAEVANIAGKKAYISYTTVTTSRKYQFHQTISVIDGDTLVRIEYAGGEKLSTADLTELGASLVL
jgi:hypothetical protein